MAGRDLQNHANTTVLQVAIVAGSQATPEREQRDPADMIRSVGSLFTHLCGGHTIPNQL